MAELGITCTPFARRYGFDAAHPELWHHNKSGLTPIGPKLVQTNSQTDKVFEAAQRDVLKGFSVQELVDHGCFPDPNARDVSLSNNIHKCFHLSNWEGLRKPIWNKTPIPIDATGPAYSLGPNPGLWLAENPIVGAVLQPVLRLATRFLAAQCASDILDGFFLGTRERLDTGPGFQNTSDYPCYVIRGRKPHLRDVDEVLWFLEKTLEQEFTLSFGDPNSALNPHIYATANGTPTWEGVTYFSYREAGGILLDPLRVNLTLNIDAYQPLLRNDLSESERLIAQYTCATTIMHELMHVLEFLVFALVDFFFEDDLYAEMGLAWETSIFGGVNYSYIPDRSSSNVTRKLLQNVPQPGTFITSQPPAAKISTSYLQKLRDGILPDTDTAEPIPGKYYEYIQDDKFWNVGVKKWGIEALKPSGPVQSIDYGGSSGYKAPITNTTPPPWDDKHSRKPGGDPPGYGNLLIASPGSRADQLLSRELGERRARQMARTKFSQGQTRFVLMSRKLWDAVKSSWSTDPQTTTFEKVASMLKFLRTECDKQEAVIVDFLVRGDKDTDHKRFLLELNQFMRALLVSFFEEHVNRTNEKEFLDEANELREKLSIALVMLHEDGIVPATNWAEFYNQSRAKCTDEYATHLVALTLTQLRTQVDDATKTNLLLEAQRVILGVDEKRCGEIAQIFADNFFAEPIMRAIAKILWNNDGTLENSRRVKDLDSDEILSMYETQTVIDDVARRGWRQVWQDMKSRMEYQDKLEYDKEDPNGIGDGLRSFIGSDSNAAEIKRGAELSLEDADARKAEEIAIQEYDWLEAVELEEYRIEGIKLAADHRGKRKAEDRALDVFKEKKRRKKDGRDMTSVGTDAPDASLPDPIARAKILSCGKRDEEEEEDKDVEIRNRWFIDVLKFHQSRHQDVTFQFRPLPPRPGSSRSNKRPGTASNGKDQGM